ncbi:MAG: hypothetical protein L0191_03070, partial [Acidobacteria bacterium]|nr:hypothetical protein [Acidobacteriota bacterium]
MREGAADNAVTQLVGVQPCQSPRSDTKRYHSPDRVTGREMRGVNGPAARLRKSRGRCNLGA